MALSLNEIKNNSQRTAKVSHQKEDSFHRIKNSSAEEKLRPWHSSMATSKEPKPPVAHQDSSQRPQDIITEILTTTFSDSWFGKIQIKPKVRIPIPKFLSTREKNKN